MRQDEEDDDLRDDAMRAENAKRKLPKYTAANVVDSIGEVNTLVANFLPRLFASLPKENDTPIEIRLEKLQTLFDTGKITREELASARGAALHKV
jgi:hypothetical protein